MKVDLTDAYIFMDEHRIPRSRVDFASMRPPQITYEAKI